VPGAHHDNVVLFRKRHFLYFSCAAVYALQTCTRRQLVLDM
jgi:hypothetical protein